MLYEVITGGWFAGLRGISRFYVLETYPEVRLYLQPISMDPRDLPHSLAPDGGAETSCVVDAGSGRMPEAPVVSTGSAEDPELVVACGYVRNNFV